ncbi:MAG: hypothetical protein LBU62_02770 [Bacteroidales bacterium]|jgi:hypothetical protein|nr:hypothetical protein [Bacteroidales bacterium]
MKKLIFASLLLSLAWGVDAQKKVTYANPQQVDAFFKSKTKVVMDANPMIGYNIVIANAVKKFWTITPFEIISSDEFDEQFNDATSSFIFLSRLTLDKKKDVSYLYMNIVMGAAKVKDITDLPELLSVPLAYAGVDEDNYVDKLPLMLQFAQIHIRRIHDKKLKMYTLRDYNDNAKELKSKTLLLKQTDLSKEVNSLEAIQKVYSGKVRIASTEEITQAIEKKEANTAVLLQVGPSEDEHSGRSYRLIYGIDNGKLLYYNYQNLSEKTPQGMLAKDFKWIEDKIN